jgi:hypothetical protein
MGRLVLMTSGRDLATLPVRRGGINRHAQIGGGWYSYTYEPPERMQQGRAEEA